MDENPLKSHILFRVNIWAAMCFTVNKDSANRIECLLTTEYLACKNMKLLLNRT